MLFIISSSGPAWNEPIIRYTKKCAEMFLYNVLEVLRIKLAVKKEYKRTDF